jgi:crotonobetainyl-CoA:carnitine CoA-transferase CaiB-like acyl-CoA transferase
LAALRHRDRTGEGQYLDASMMDTLATLMFMEPLEEALANGQPVRAGNDSRTSPTGLYRARDADIIVTVAGAGQWAGLCEALDAPELLADARFAPGSDRAKYMTELKSAIQDRIGRLTCAEAIERLKASDVPVAPVRKLSDVVADDHFYRRGTFKPMRHEGLKQTVEGGIVVGFPVAFSSGPLPDLIGAPTLGMHNEEILGGVLSLDSEQLQKFKDRGII